MLLAAGCGQTAMRTSKSASHTTTPTPTTPPQRAWHIVPGLQNLLGTSIALALASSDPQVAYSLGITPSCSSSVCPQYTLKESDDDGAHWNARTVPSVLSQYAMAGRPWVYIYVSPLQPQVRC